MNLVFSTRGIHLPSHTASLDKKYILKNIPKGLKVLVMPGQGCISEKETEIKYVVITRSCKKKNPMFRVVLGVYPHPKAD